LILLFEVFCSLYRVYRRLHCAWWQLDLHGEALLVKLIENGGTGWDADAARNEF